jgi:hypothetical protein
MFESLEPSLRILPQRLCANSGWGFRFNLCDHHSLPRVTRTFRNISYCDILGNLWEFLHHLNTGRQSL